MTMRRHAEPPREQYSLFDDTMPLRNKDNADELPKTARDLVQVIGLDATIDLVKVFGGDELMIPAVVNGTARMWEILVETVGVAAATRLVEFYAGSPIYVPKCEALLRTHRDREIHRRYDAGEPFDVLRREFKMTRSWLFRLLKKQL